MASKVFWITRDEYSRSHYEMWAFREHPQKDESGNYPIDAPFACCCGEFESLTGITLKPGQKKKFRLVEV